VASRSERVLVTGGSGFTGTHLCAHLRAAGYRVFSLTDSATRGTDTIQADLLDSAALAAAVRETVPHHVVHLAAISFPGHTQANEVYRVNLEGSLNLLATLASAHCGQQGVVLASTGTIYGGTESDALDEDVRPAPISHYAVSKFAMEHMALLFAAAVPVTIVRPFNYTGPGQGEPFLVPKIVRHFAERADVIELGNIDVVRDFLDVRVVVDVYRRLLAAPVRPGAIYNVCSGRGIALRDIVETLESITGHAIDVRVNPQFVRAGEPRRIVGSPARLRAAVGEFALIPLATTLADMLREREAQPARNDA
jgi:nucleoside-diphosphate-sugar epimerase